MSENVGGELNRLLDNGHAITIFKNDLGSYTAYTNGIELAGNYQCLTDDFTPAKAISRLADKVLKVGDYVDYEED
jgi:hypothetical protein